MKTRQAYVLTVLLFLGLLLAGCRSNQVLTTAWAAGQYDWLCGWSDGTRFMEFARANN